MVPPSYLLRLYTPQAYFSNNPKVTLMRYKVTERPKGEILLAGAQIQAPGPMPRGAPVEHGFQVQLHSGKTLWMGMSTRESAEAWHSALTSASKGEAVSRRASVIMADAAGAGGAWAHITTVPSRPHAMSGWLMKSAPDNRTWTKRWAVLDPASAQLAYSEQAGSPVLGTLQLEDGTTVVPGVGPAVLAAVGSSAAAHMPGFHVIGAPAWKGTEQPKLRAMGKALRKAAGDELPPSAAVGMPAIAASAADDETLDGSRVYTFLAQDESTLQRWVTALVSAKVGAAYGATGVIAPIGSGGSGLARLQAAAKKVMHISVATRLAAPKNLSGWLYKSNSAGKYWKRRWMKVWVSPPHPEHGICAMYYTSLDEKCLKGIVVLNGGKIEIGKREHLLQLKNAPTVQGVVLTTASRCWRFSMDTIRDCEKWVVALSQGVFLSDRMSE